MPYFRRAERAALRDILDETGSRRVLATGGGIVTERETFDLLKAHTCTVWLEASPEEHWNRVVAQGDLRPMAGSMAGSEKAFEALCSILEARRPLYQQARWTVDTTGRDVDAISKELAHTLAPEFA